MNFSRRVMTGMMAGWVYGAAMVLPSVAVAADLGPDAFVTQLTNEMLQAVKADKAMTGGDMAKIGVLVDTRLMPHVNFKRMTASAVGPAWNKASPEQQKQLQDEFKTLLVRIYSGAFAQINDQTISVKPTRVSAEDTEVVVKSEVRGQGDPIQLDYRLEKTPGVGLGWKIYNFNVMGVWMMETYRSQFAKEVNSGGIEGLLGALKQRNQSNLKK